MDHVLICTPVALGLVPVQHNPSLVASIVNLGLNGIEVTLRTHESTSIVGSRNMAAAEMLIEPMFSHLMFLDADLSWPEYDAITRMVKLNRDIVCGVYPTRGLKPRWTISALNGAESDWTLDKDGLLPITLAPTGFMLLKRRVFVHLANVRPDLEVSFEGEGREPYHYLFFDARRSEPVEGKPRHYMTDDYGFSETWTQAGGKLWAYPDVTLRHWYWTCNEGNLGHWIKEQVGAGATVAGGD